MQRLISIQLNLSEYILKQELFIPLRKVEQKNKKVWDIRQ